MLRLLTGLALVLGLCADAGPAKAQGLYDAYASNCRLRGNVPESRAAYESRGGDFNTEFRCDPSSYSRTTTPLVGVCNTTEARLHIDWIFRTPSARTSYQARRTEGLLPFEAAKAAQGHNPSARASIAACPNWASSYLAGLDSSNGSEVLAGRQLTAADCRCVSIRPSDSSTTMGNLAFTVRGNCDLMRVTVNFSGQLMSSWTRPVTVGNGRRETVSAPNTGDISVASYRLQNAAGEFTCRVERAPQSTMAP